MSLSLLAFVPADGPRPAVATLAAAVAAQPGSEVDGSEAADYRPWRWRDPVTGARCLGDAGRAPLDEDPTHPEREYPGWEAAGLAIHVPVTGPHWLTYDIAELAAGLSADIPELAWLNTEDIRRDDDEEGPGDLASERLMASREQLLESFLEQRDSLPHMPRADSRALWRYRRALPERRAASDDDLLWPGILVLGDGERALRATMWLDCERDLALPPVDLVIVRRADDESGVLPVDEVLAAAGRGEPLDDLGTRRLRMDAALRRCHAEARLIDPTRYRPLDELDWRD